MEGKVFVDDKVWYFQDLDRQGCMFPPVSHRALPSIVRRGRTPQIGAVAKNSPSSQTFANMNNSVPLTQNRHFHFHWMRCRETQYILFANTMEKSNANGFIHTKGRIMRLFKNKSTQQKGFYDQKRALIIRCRASL